ncbi:MAG: sugar transferase [Pseudomonadota bacterium]
MQLKVLETPGVGPQVVVPANDDGIVEGESVFEHAQTPTKRVFDIAVAIFGLIFFGPILIGFAIAIKLSDGGPAIFSQMRRGKGGRMFRCYKLRSMVPNAPERLKMLLATDINARNEWNLTQKLQNDPRITPIGRFIRKTSIDELPQFFNVLIGDMSLVGPRPIIDKEVSRYGKYIADYDKVRPGLTGLWQVSGRCDLGYSERVALDAKYANSRSFWGDLKISILTVPAVLFTRGAV